MLSNIYKFDIFFFTMAYRCTLYNKILVGPKKTCDSCEISDLQSMCDHRVWQNGVLKEGGRRARGERRQIWPHGTRGPGFYYNLQEDGNYHYWQTIPSWSLVGSNEVKIPALAVLTPEEMAFVKKNCRNYFVLLNQKNMHNRM